jgi:hypothetical protein
MPTGHERPEVLTMDEEKIIYEARERAADLVQRQ